MSQGIFGTIVPTTTSGNQLATILNDFKEAIVSGFSGTSRPSELDPGGYWIDTTNDPTTWEYKMWTGVQDITIFTLNLTTGAATIGSADSLFEVARISADSVGPILRLLKERIANNGQTLEGDTIGEIQFFGTRDSGVNVDQAKIKAISTDDVTSSVKGAYLSFEVTPDASSAIVEVMRLINSSVGIGITAPEEKLHVKAGSIKAENESDTVNAQAVIIRKKRVAGSGQVLDLDNIGQVKFQSTDDSGVMVESAEISVSANENHSSAQHGTKIVIKNKKQGETAYTEQIVIEDGVKISSLEVVGDLVVQGTTTSINTATLEVEDANILINKNGTQAIADAQKSGLTVEMSDATDARIGYDSTKASKFVIGEVGTEKEIVTVSDSQTLTNKTFTSPSTTGASIVDPARVDFKKDTEANLTTYALTATSGQGCYATDTETYYGIVDNELVPFGAGGGGSSIKWIDGVLAPLKEVIDGMEFNSFGSVDPQELYAIITIPSSYRPGKPITITNGNFFANVASGKVRFRAATALINSSTVLGVYSNIHNSTNAEVTVPGVANTIAAIGVIQLTDAVGEINAVQVQAGDKLRVRIYRDYASESSPAAADARLLTDSFEIKFR
jgi:hypothetical protein